MHTAKVLLGEEEVDLPLELLQDVSSVVQRPTFTADYGRWASNR